MRHAGFTLIELVAVIVVAGIMALVVAPKMNFSAFSVLGFYDRTCAALRVARSAAIAQRRWVRVTDAGGGLDIRACAGVGDGCAADLNGCALSVLDPATGQSLSVAPPAGVSLSHDSGYAGQFYFDCEGRPMRDAGTATGTVVYTVGGDADSGNLRFSVEAETGYVHR